jgi:mono/diheme cytochrome c family protein
MNTDTELVFSLEKLIFSVGLCLLCLTGTVVWLAVSVEKVAENTQMGWCGTANPVRNQQKHGAGKELFLNNCASCHNKNMKDDMTGPALAGVENRWEKYPRKQLFDYIRHPKLSAENGQPRAKMLLKKWSPTIMTDFPDLSDAQIEAILGYISGK